MHNINHLMYKLLKVWCLIHKATSKGSTAKLYVLQKLEQVVKDALVSRGVAVEDDIFESCALRLYGITKSYVKVRVVTTFLSILLSY